jgi:hypothetical protein
METTRRQVARMRMLKPELFLDYELWAAEHGSGLPVIRAYEGLWCVADRAGRFKWQAQRIKAQVLPYDELDMDALLEVLVAGGWIERYGKEGEYGWVTNFTEHQKPNHREARSVIPHPPGHETATFDGCACGLCEGERAAKAKAPPSHSPDRNRNRNRNRNRKGGVTAPQPRRDHAVNKEAKSPKTLSEIMKEAQAHA